MSMMVTSIQFGSPVRCSIDISERFSPSFPISAYRLRDLQRKDLRPPRIANPSSPSIHLLHRFDRWFIDVLRLLTRCKEPLQVPDRQTKRTESQGRESVECSKRNWSEFQGCRWHEGDQSTQCRGKLKFLLHTLFEANEEERQAYRKRKLFSLEVKRIDGSSQLSQTEFLLALIQSSPSKFIELLSILPPVEPNERASSVSSIWQEVNESSILKLREND